LDSTAAELRAFERDLNALQESIEPLRRQALEAKEEARRQRDETEEEAQRQREEAAALREQLETRDAESRQTALRVEVERQELEREQSLLATTRDELAQAREQAEQESERVQAAIRERVSQLRQAEQSLLAAPARWWLRSSVLAVLAAIPTFIGWLAWDTPRYRSSATLLIDSQHGPATTVAAEHVARILSPGRIESVLRDPELTEWSAALADRRISVTNSENQPAVELAVTAPDAAAARRLAQAAAEGYRHQVNSTPAEPRRASFAADLTERRASVAGELADWQARRQASADVLENLADQPRRNECQAEVERLQADYVQVTQTLEAERQRLQSLRALDVPPADVTPDAYQQALSADAVYQEDLKELEAEARKYRAELAVAMARLVDPLASLRKATHSLATTLAEQKELRPPTKVMAVLEACVTQVETFDEESAEFSPAWQRRRQALEQWETEDGVVGLVRQQEAAANAADSFLERGRALVRELDSHIESLSSEGSSGTREIVVTAALRADLEHLGAQIATLAEATAATNVTVNFRLDAHDRQLRGIRTRLQSRRDAICRQVDEQADHQSRTRHAEYLAELANTVTELEQQREDLLLGLAGKVEELRSLDEQLLEREGLETDVRQAESTIEQLTVQLSRLDDALEQARRGGPRPDRIRGPVAVRDEQVAGVHRFRNAGLAAAAIFATAWLISLLMILKNPLRPRESVLPGELIETPPPEAP
jgi:chromosome segregation ATPase